MRDLSLHVLDIVMNSINANAQLIEIIVNESPKKDLLELTIIDNGHGMDEVEVKQVLNPFYTTRTTRHVGLGLPLLAQNATITNGDISVISKPNVGTTVYVSFGYTHIDRIPIGNMAETILTLILLEPMRDFIYRHHYENETYELDTRQIKEVLDGVPINHKSVLNWLKEDLKQAF